MTTASSYTGQTQALMVQGERVKVSMATELCWTKGPSHPLFCLK